EYDYEHDELNWQANPSFARKRGEGELPTRCLRDQDTRDGFTQTVILCNMAEQCSRPGRYASHDRPHWSARLGLREKQAILCRRASAAAVQAAHGIRRLGGIRGGRQAGLLDRESGPDSARACRLSQPESRHRGRLLPSRDGGRRPRQRCSWSTDALPPQLLWGFRTRSRRKQYRSGVPPGGVANTSAYALPLARRVVVRHVHLRHSSIRVKG